jgi:hypothetical protein
MPSPHLPIAAALALLLLLAAPAARATIMSGPILIDPPTSLGPNPIGDASFFAFHEQQDQLLASSVRVNGGWVEAGTRVSSHYVLYDPTDVTRRTVTITFDSEILGVVTKDRRLRKSDWLGARGVEYKRFRHRGREWRDHYEISADGRSITFRMRANNPGDYMRVLTRGRDPIPPPPPPPPIEPPSAVPEPGAALLFGLGAAWIGRFTGRKRQPSRS